MASPEKIDSSESSPQSQEYTVRPGDTLSRIAQKHGFKSWKELEKLQGEGFNADKLRIGQKLKMRETPKPSVDPAAEVSKITDDQMMAKVAQARLAAEAVKSKVAANELLDKGWPDVGSRKDTAMDRSTPAPAIDKGHPWLTNGEIPENLLLNINSNSDYSNKRATNVLGGIKVYINNEIYSVADYFTGLETEIKNGTLSPKGGKEIKQILQYIVRSWEHVQSTNKQQINRKDDESLKRIFQQANWDINPSKAKELLGLLDQKNTVAPANNNIENNWNALIKGRSIDSTLIPGLNTLLKAPTTKLETNLPGLNQPRFTGEAYQNALKTGAIEFLTPTKDGIPALVKSPSGEQFKVTLQYDIPSNINSYNPKDKRWIARAESYSEA